jgi:hypothetical protein
VLDKKQRTQRIALRMIGHPFVVIPGVLGAGAFILSLIGVGGGIGAFAGIILALIATGVLTWRFLFRLKQTSQETLDDIQKEIESERQKHISKLRGKLSSDRDKRDERLLDELCEVEQAFKADKSWMEQAGAGTVMQVLNRVGEVFETSLKLLERSFDLRQTANRLHGEARDQLLKTSDEILEQVGQSVNDLGKILAGVQKLSVQRLTGQTMYQSDLQQGVKELKLILDAAQQAEDRCQKLFSGSGDKDRFAEYLKE